MNNKIEYIDKSTLTEEHKKEIEKSANEFIKGKKKDVKLGYIILSIILLLLIMFFCFMGIKDNEWLIILVLLGCFFIPCYIFTFLANNFNKEYVIIKAKVIKKQLEQYHNSHIILNIVTLLNENREYKFEATNKAYSKIKKDEIRYLVIVKKNNSNITSGKIISDVTDILEE